MRKIILICCVLFSGLSGSAQKIENVELLRKIDRQPLIIDLRTIEEYKEGTILGSMNFEIPSEEFIKSIVDLPRHKEIILFCKSGEKSKEAIEVLKSMGFIKISELDGGYDSWKALKEEKKTK